MKKLLFLTLAVTLSISSQEIAPTPIPEGYWPEAKSKAILDKTITIRLAPDLSVLTPEERKALKSLLKAGEIMQKLYEQQKHPEALAAFAELRTIDARNGSPARTKNLRTLYRLFRGPIATTLDNKREPFLPVSAERPGKNVYPLDADKKELDAFLAAHPEV